MTSAKALSVGDVMTSQPLTIGREQPTSTAREMMRTLDVHHLPILERGELVGVLTSHDHERFDTVDAYAVGPDAPLGEVAAEMVARRSDCAVVIERGRVAGIFTSQDALRVIAGLMP
ncbi:MAG: CBS domain-containing protein [Labilithrix sp.]|nr:CBS domain-containing protein [Labilithrix sp.]